MSQQTSEYFMQHDIDDREFLIISSAVSTLHLPFIWFIDLSSEYFNRFIQKRGPEKFQTFQRETEIHWGNAVFH